MARFNEILAARLNRALQKFLGIKGEAPAPQLASEVMAVLAWILGNETLMLEGWYQWAAFASIAGVAAQNSTCMLRNPGGSGVLAVVRKASFSLATAINNAKLFQSNPSVDLANAITSIPLDNRQPSGSQSGLRVSSTTLAGNPVGANAIEQMTLATAVTADFVRRDFQALILPPGAGLIIQNSTVNDILTAQWWWIERPIEDSEKSA